MFLFTWRDDNFVFRVWIWNTIISQIYFESEQSDDIWNKIVKSASLMSFEHLEGLSLTIWRIFHSSSFKNRNWSILIDINFNFSWFLTACFTRCTKNAYRFHCVQHKETRTVISADLMSRTFGNQYLVPIRICYEIQPFLLNEIPPLR